MVDPQAGEKLQVGSRITDPQEIEFIRIYRRLPKAAQTALIAALQAAPGYRYQSALSVLAKVYEAPEGIARGAAELADLLTGAGWKLPAQEVQG